MFTTIRKNWNYGKFPMWDKIFCFVWYWWEYWHGHFIIVKSYDNGKLVDVVTPTGIKRMRRSDI